MTECLEQLLQGTTLTPLNTGKEQPNDKEEILKGTQDENSNLLKIYRKIHNKRVINKSRKDINSKLSMKDVLKTVNTERISNLAKNLDPIAQRSKVTKKPTSIPVSSRALRIAASTNTNKAVGKWEHFVTTNNQAQFLTFDEPRYNPITTTQDIASNFRPNSLLEKKLLGMVSDNVNSIDFKDTELSIAEQRALEKVSLEEARMRRTELKRFRILLSKYEAKCKREKRIKSKHFHKMKRKEKFKNAYFDNNEDKLERVRIRERVTLKHTHGSKWIKRLNKINFNDKNARNILHKQKEVAREMKKHPRTQVNDDSDTEHPDTTEGISEISRFISNSKNPWLKPQQDSVLLLSEDKESRDTSDNKWLESQLNESGFNKDDVAAAFAYDDITLDFMDEKEQKETEELEESDSLPGWGRWAGKDGNIENKKFSKKEMKKKSKKPRPKAKFNLPLVILNDERKDDLRKHQVIKVPFPFQSQSHFESTLHKPTGREWNTESRFIEKTRPRFSVPTGKIIPPAGGRKDPHKDRNKN
ncbi:U3 small nucleolar RNA-associated protein 14 [Oopsacas minuta]|uniref:U3 small nucleolar RNA-associated protein 14 n=1 Tax=Oopsacas minuta TaxID=111878 RepID=A0AAV7K5H7_9METZ|nr:U3 small nucleolar RNA-associated protein 14 [Oopsacas minuta]